MNEEPSAVPLDVNLSDDIKKAITAATAEHFQNLERLVANSPMPQQASGQPKGYYADPFSMMENVGLGYRENPMQVTYTTLRRMNEGNTLLGAITNTRTNQVFSFCREQENKYSVGHLVRLKGLDNRNRRLTNGERDRKKKIEHYLQNMGESESITRDPFSEAMKKLVRDSLTYDQMNFENQWSRGGQLKQSIVTDASTIRIADQSKTNPRGLPLSKEEEKTRHMYAQLLNGEVVANFTAREMAFCIRNPRSSLRVGGYGFPEAQMLMLTVTAHIWAEEWNRRAFSQGSTIKGVLNMKGAIDRQKYDAFKRQWMNQVGGILNAWKTPIMNSDGIEFVPMQMSNTEMGYQMWIEYLVKMACAIYQMDPTEINFDLRGSAGAGQPTFMSGNEAQQKMSKDRGLKPLLRFFEDSLNRNIINHIDPGFELAFVGLDAKSEAEAIELRQKQGMTHYTINELRALDDMDPIKEGQIVANPTYTSWLQNQAMQQQQGGGAGGMPGAQGMDDQQQDQQPMEQPYSGRFSPQGSPPTEMGKEHGGKLLQFAKQGQQKKGGDQDQMEDDDDIRVLKRNDWASTVHASLGDNDLKKSNPIEDLFFEVDV